MLLNSDSKYNVVSLRWMKWVASRKTHTTKQQQKFTHFSSSSTCHLSELNFEWKRRKKTTWCNELVDETSFQRSQQSDSVNKFIFLLFKKSNENNLLALLLMMTTTSTTTTLGIISLACALSSPHRIECRGRMWIEENMRNYLRVRSTDWLWLLHRTHSTTHLFDTIPPTIIIWQVNDQKTKMRKRRNCVYCNIKIHSLLNQQMHIE